MSSEQTTSVVSVEHIQRVSDLFDQLCAEREEMGEQKYGTLTWLNNDTIGMAMEELLDLANYVRYSFIRLYLMNDRLQAAGPGHNVPLGKTAFTPAKETQ